MPKHNLRDFAAGLPHSWRSSVLATAGSANFKVLRMDSQSYPAGSHPYDEALLVLEGCMNLEVEGKHVAVEQGEVFIVPAGLPHSVAAGSHGILVIVDQ